MVQTVDLIKRSPKVSVLIETQVFMHKNRADARI